MGWLRPALAALFGLVIAPAAGLTVLPVLVLVEPVARDHSFAFVQLLLQLLDEVDSDPSAAEEVRAFLGFLYTAVIAIGFFPIVLVAAFAALGKQRSWAYYSVATGTVTAAMPWALRYAFPLPRAGAASAMEVRLALVLFLTGVVIGSVYWFISSTFGCDRNNTAS